MRVQIIYTAGHPRVASLALTGNSPSEGTPPYSIILYYGMLVKPLDKMYPVGCDDLGAPYQTVGTICIRIRAHLTISWAANDRPYGITVADEFTCGAPGSYPRAPSLALRAIHLVAPYGQHGHYRYNASFTCGTLPQTISRLPFRHRIASKNCFSISGETSLT